MHQPLIGVGRPTAAAGSPLLTGLVAYWKLDEASGNAVDSHGSNTLTDTNTVTSASGKQGTARQFTGANSECLQIADNAALSMGNFDFTIAAWVYFDSGGGSPVIAGKFSGAGENREYALWFNSGAGYLSFIISSDGTTGGQVYVDAAAFGAIATGTWYLVIGWHDSVADNISIQVNNGSISSFLHSAGVFDGAAPFVIGALGASSQYFDGRIDEVGVWKRLLTSTERGQLWNSSVGRTYPFPGT